MGSLNRILAVALIAGASLSASSEPLPEGEIAALKEVENTDRYTRSNFDLNRELRINRLIPTSWIDFPCISPGIPEDFEAMEDIQSWQVFWGRKQDLDAFARRKRDEMTYPIIGLTHSMHCDVARLCQHWEKRSFDKESNKDTLIECVDYLNWGLYPVIGAQATLKQDEKIVWKTHAAWVGLVDSDGGSVLFCRLIHPGNSSEPLDQHKQLCETVWNEFLQNTECLTDRDYILSSGQDMQEGETTMIHPFAHFKVTAEKRRRDGRFSVSTQPITENTTFEVDTVWKGNMGTDWKFGYPCMKVAGTATRTLENGKNVLNATVTVLIQEVDEFSATDNLLDGFSRQGEYWISNAKLLQSPSHGIQKLSSTTGFGG